MYKKKISELESEYRICFAEMEDKHQEKIVSILAQAVFDRNMSYK